MERAPCIRAAGWCWLRMRRRSAVWGMPGRVSEAGIASATLPLWGIASALKQRVSVGRPARSEAAVVLRGLAMAPRREMTHGLL